MKPLRVMALMHKDLMPPEKAPEGVDLATAEWKTEYDIVTTLREAGHEVRPLGLRDDLSVIHEAIDEWKPQIVFNLLEEFAGNAVYDQNVVAYLELLRIPYTGCNPRGLMLARDKILTKKVLAYHDIPSPDFFSCPLGETVKRPKELEFPLIVKSVSEEASLGISQASIVEDDEKLKERVSFIHNSVGTSALVERYIEGRELYVGVLGTRHLQVLPVWELNMEKMPEESRRIATERVKWSRKYQAKYGITSGAAKDLPNGLPARIQHLARRVYRMLGLSGYARVDFRVDKDMKVYVLEANPNPQIAHDEDFAESAGGAGIAYKDLLQRIINIGLRWRPGRL